MYNETCTSEAEHKRMRRDSKPPRSGTGSLYNSTGVSGWRVYYRLWSIPDLGDYDLAETSSKLGHRTTFDGNP
ncbi:hypothetical protein POX_f07731 [Penicillium oxalicum]|uniref:Uncharacterized protein n=1 Tax=Penicillium oxalicum (strain 114-2 / CGMCC 5302) TaxID=933388 RepID=S7ZIY5_PENO1|nr:hypothetical protein POX_f07731 [Penicillium oxalicum]EPS28651.1 hypothetical protein PDE_03597 [Penicillium oxalicum 114-2]KAI2787367.1 hypothetical protein POX_f07731 [Penicillium oxalicum]